VKTESCSRLDEEGVKAFVDVRGLNVVVSKSLIIGGVGFSSGILHVGLCGEIVYLCGRSEVKIVIFLYSGVIFIASNFGIRAI